MSGAHKVIIFSVDVDRRLLPDSRTKIPTSIIFERLPKLTARAAGSSRVQTRTPGASAQCVWKRRRHQELPPHAEFRGASPPSVGACAEIWLRIAVHSTGVCSAVPPHTSPWERHNNKMIMIIMIIMPLQQKYSACGM